ncbi:hypothetical protein BCR42DRAFT_74793 [Absidia repens]|uniref:Secreted protein n=1 Tax=Absidia repens TaxID=90262 RepID=A0A1X2IA28_9FUNG|nr:hypothetical protein BCR42DRAFT_74793 [Absidia repens]
MGVASLVGLPCVLWLFSPWARRQYFNVAHTSNWTLLDSVLWEGCDGFISFTGYCVMVTHNTRTHLCIEMSNGVAVPDVFLKSELEL